MALKPRRPSALTVSASSFEETSYYWGDHAYSSLLDANVWEFGNSGETTHPVGMKAPNAFSLYDMGGNVAEWCEDDYHASYNVTGTNPDGGGTIPTRPDDGGAWVDAGTRGTYRVMRGGSWSNVYPDCRSANRTYAGPVFRANDYGLRLVLAAPKNP